MVLDKLIKEGEEIENEASEGMVGKFFESVKFEAWVSKSVLYLEKNHNKSSLTSKVIEKNKKLSSNNNYEFYQFLLGTLRAIKESEDDEILTV